MANTLTNLIPTIYEALDMVSRELVGFIPAVTMDAAAERAAVNQTIRVPIAPAAAAENITPASTPPDTGDQTIGSTTVTITKARAVPFRWTGEEQRGVNSGPGYANIRRDQVAQAMRTLCNEVEADLAALYTAASRAHGTAGTAPFGSSPNVGDAADVLKILLDNGCPPGDLHLVIDTAASTNLRKLTQLTKANEAGGDEFLRQGILGNLFGLQIHESAQVKLHTKGTGASYNSDLVAGYAVGDTTIHVEVGTGTILAGDVGVWTGDANKYIVGTGFAGDGDGDIVLNDPGLRATLANDVALTIGNTYRANMAFHRSAMLLVARAPALPEEGDLAVDRTIVTDPRSGLSFEVSMYREYRRVRYEMALAWGVANIKSAHSVILLG